MLATDDTVQPHIVILGAGFAGLYTALHLAKRVRRARQSVRITLIDQHNYFLFTPLMHEVAVDGIAAHHVIHPIRHAIRDLPVTFHETCVEGIDLRAKRVHTRLGPIAYDYLVIALGAVTNYYGNDTARKYSFPLKTVGEAYRLRNHILSMFEMASETTDPAVRQQLLTFVCVGAGFTGIETMPEIRDLIHHDLLRDYPTIRPDEVRLLMVDGLPGLPVPANATLADTALRTIRGLGIEVRFNTLVTDVGPTGITLATGEQIPAGTVIWTAGIATNPVVAALPVPQGPGKRVTVTATMQLPDYPEVFALGDCAAFTGADGKPLSATAQVANQQAPVLADNLLRVLRGAPPRPFVFHKLGELASLGNLRAVADLNFLQITGFLAWWMWRSVYLIRLPWWSNRFHIVSDWTLDLFFPRDASRIEVASCAACEREDCPRKSSAGPSG